MAYARTTMPGDRAGPPESVPALHRKPEVMRQAFPETLLSAVVRIYMTAPVRRVLTAVIVVASLHTLGVYAVAGQRLDIGGIELSLGQDISVALSKLSAYKVTYNDNAGWYVSQLVGDEYQLLGALAATAAKVSLLTKQYSLPEPWDTQGVYTLAAKDVRRLGGPNCATRDVEYTDDTIHAIETQCGRYKLTLFLPGRYNGAHVGPSISLSVTTQGAQ